MCGIYGLVKTAGLISDRDLLDKSCSLAHRGPDAEGFWVSPGRRVGFAHKRLRIIDLSNAGAQPMRACNDNLVCIFNGEIYNFKDIKKELKYLGYQFFTESDTEVLLKSYEHWGQECILKLDGMFSFAIYDQSDLASPFIFFARDRTGEKPFYYIKNDDGFEFASELKALNFGDKINVEALNFYLSLGYIPDDKSIVEGVKKLLPGHCGYYHLNDKTLKIIKYWGLPKKSLISQLSIDEYSEKAAVLLKNSVRSRLISDVPVGVLLSGGLDSSLIAAAAANVSSAPIQTFTVTLPNSNLNEEVYAKSVSDYLSTSHTTIPLQKSSIDMLEEFSGLIDEPLADSSLLPSWIVYGLCRKYVKVVLGGDGGDEIFGGYSDYLISLRDQKLIGWVNSSLIELMANISAHMPAGVKGRNKISSFKQGPLKQMIWGRPYFDVALRKKILSNKTRTYLDGNLMAPELFLLKLYATGEDAVDSMMRTHFSSMLPDDFLFKVDRTSMMHGLEVRSPFLDHNLIEFLYSEVPTTLKVFNGKSRILEKILAKKWLPSSLNFERKQGFSIPINEWLREYSERELLKKLEPLPDSINMDYVKELVKAHMNGRANGGRLFSLIMLSISTKNLKLC